MRANLGPSVDLDFLDGYLFRLLQEIAADHGLERSGLYNYYGSRITERIGGLIEYEADLARYLLDRHPGGRLVHAGIGVGMLACALACNGMTVAGIEQHPRRVVSAQRLRGAVVETWPDVENRYEIVVGYFPAALIADPEPPGWMDRLRRRPLRTRPAAQWLDSGAVLVFTNVASNWSDDLTASIVAVLPRFAEVVLDLRLFGVVRDTDDERQALFDRLAAQARSAERLPDFSPGCHIARFSYA